LSAWDRGWLGFRTNFVPILRSCSGKGSWPLRWTARDLGGGLAGATEEKPVTNAARRSCNGYMESMAQDDRELLRAARRGDAECFGTLFRKHHSVVLAFLARRVGEPEVAADLLAETFAALLTVVRDPRRDLPASPMGWLLVTARNLLVDRHRHGIVAEAARRRFQLAPAALDDHDIELIVEAGQDDELLRRIYELLPVEQADALTARVINELDYPVIARGANTSEAVIRKRVSRALATLRAGLGS
jgi:RNA polymerase sigma factor (sigma-70 family)